MDYRKAFGPAWKWIAKWYQVREGGGGRGAHFRLTHSRRQIPPLPAIPPLLPLLFACILPSPPTRAFRTKESLSS